jgi:hypothetical protein
MSDVSNVDPMKVLTDYGTPILIDQLKQYVKSSKQIFEYSSRRNFPEHGKVGNVYLDTSDHSIWLYDVDDGYTEFTSSYVRDGDNILIDCGVATDNSTNS